MSTFNRLVEDPKFYGRVQKIKLGILVVGLIVVGILWWIGWWP